jgi:hypothetical protein
VNERKSPDPTAANAAALPYEVEEQQARRPGFNAAAEGIVNDISAGQQGVNPVALSEKRGQAVGVLKDGYVDVDGVREPLENYPADRFVTRTEGGASYIYPRTPDIAENRLASAGRQIGYGMAGDTGNALMAGAKAQAPSNALRGATAAEDLGITPSFAMGGPTRARIAAAGEQFGPTAGRFRGDAMRANDEMAEAAGRLADRVGAGATPADAGEALKSGAESFRSGIKDRQGMFWGAVDKAVPAATGVDTPATMAVLAREGEKLRKLPNTISPDRLKAMEDGTMTWEQARALRTDIGTALRSFDGSETNVAKGQLDQIYGALSKDLEATVEKAGPEAARAWRAANTYTRVSEKRISEAFGKVLGDKVTPEQAYDRIVGMAQEGGSRANIGALSKAFRSLPKEDAAQVAGTIVRRLGRAGKGAQGAEGDTWSAATFLTNWNGMSKEARAVIGRSGLDPNVGEELGKLATVVERAKDAGTVRNTSNTAGAATNIGLGMTVVTALLTGHPFVAAGVAGSAGAANLSARAMTNPTFLKALNGYARGQTGPLREIAKGTGPLALEAATILRLQAPESSQQIPATAPEPAFR